MKESPPDSAQWQVSQTPDLEYCTGSYISLLENQTLRTVSAMLPIQVYRVFWLLLGPFVLMSQCRLSTVAPGGPKLKVFSWLFQARKLSVKHFNRHTPSKVLFLIGMPNLRLFSTLFFCWGVNHSLLFLCTRVLNLSHPSGCQPQPGPLPS